MDPISRELYNLKPAEEALLAQVPVTEESLPFLKFLINPTSTFQADLIKKIEQLKRAYLPLFENIENGLYEIEELLKTVERRIFCEAGSIEAEVGKEIYAARFGLAHSSPSRLTPRFSTPSPSPLDLPSTSPIKPI